MTAAESVVREDYAEALAREVRAAQRIFDLLPEPTVEQVLARTFMHG